ncbi:arachidonate 5-lipoxygenase-like protein [Labeo rohita]|uniref:Arachidonate 5-lipoxygenase-like protein n=1 Tax=Labeo rohita TaxID=84645 RepID=A0A498LIZ2_LABRO|nr:arachidonate 5-lipoxygenase-like protein [Labeo rohita]
MFCALRTYLPIMDSAEDTEVRQTIVQQGILLGRQQEEINVWHQAVTNLTQQLAVISQRLDQIQISPLVVPTAAALVVEEAPTSC